jgi:hypothetical protein
MSEELLEEIVAALAALDSGSAFATELTCPSEGLGLEVKGIGRLGFPIPSRVARKLCDAARPAPFGRRAQTLLDRNVRDTWEIGLDHIKIDTQAWRRALAPQLATIQRRLGLPESGEIDAVLDKMLVYAPGQFFVAHQDSERADDMVGSLIVVLPSAHEGGALVVEHRGKKQILRGTQRGTALSLLAFYSDCRHEVQPVRSGHRIVLTYHLLHRRAAKRGEPLRAPAIEGLARSVETYFSTPVADRWSKRPPAPPERLVYILDHEYTQKSLAWERFKGADRKRARALRTVAKRFDCELYLALADVHENWTCDGDDGGGWRRGGWRDEYEERDPEEYELLGLNDTEIELRHWLGADGRVARGLAARPDTSEVCFTRASSEMSPFKSEHEGYMGNYGNTVDRWYHRAAVVMWPRERDFSVRAKLSPAWAIKELTKALRGGAVTDARRRARDLVPFWSTSVRHEEGSQAFVRQLVVVATKLDDVDVALQLLAPLGAHRVTSQGLPTLVAAVEHYGLAWSQKLFATWHDGERYDSPSLLSTLPQLCAHLAEAGDPGRALAAWLLERDTAACKKRHADELASPVALLEHALEHHLRELLSIVQAAAVLGATTIVDDLVSFLTTPATELPPLASASLLETIVADLSPRDVRALGLGRLHRHVVASLERAVVAKPRAPDDWSILPPSGCSCALCAELAWFLRDRWEVRYDWPLAKERRRHIHGIIDLNRLPVTHVTIRHGSPQTLVLEKQPSLFERDAEQRAQEKRALAALKKHRAAFSEAPVRARERAGKA